MIERLNTEKDYVLALEITDKYVPEDEKQFAKWFDEKLAEGHHQVNILCKIDKLPIAHVSCKAFMEEGLYGLRHIRNCGHIAIVGHSKLEKFMIALDGMVFNRAKKGRIERYFDIDDIEAAWEFVYDKTEGN